MPLPVGTWGAWGHLAMFIASIDILSSKKHEASTTFQNAYFHDCVKWAGVKYAYLNLNKNKKALFLGGFVKSHHLSLDK